MLPHYETNQLTPYLREFNLVSGTTRGAAIGASPFWYGYPIYTNTISGYGANSTASNTTSEPAADTTAGNVVADAGFGGSAQ
jgi:hypothetical protein